MQIVASGNARVGTRYLMENKMIVTRNTLMQINSGKEVIKAKVLSISSELLGGRKVTTFETRFINTTLEKSGIVNVRTMNQSGCMEMNTFHRQFVNELSTGNFKPVVSLDI